MTCPNCGAELTPAGDGWTVCEECGWSSDPGMDPYETEPVDKFIARMERKRSKV